MLFVGRVLGGFASTANPVGKEHPSPVAAESVSPERGYVVGPDCPGSLAAGPVTLFVLEAVYLVSSTDLHRTSPRLYRLFAYRRTESGTTGMVFHTYRIGLEMVLRVAMRFYISYGICWSYHDLPKEKGRVRPIGHRWYMSWVPNITVPYAFVDRNLLGYVSLLRRLAGHNGLTNLWRHCVDVDLISLIFGDGYCYLNLIDECFSEVLKSKERLGYCPTIEQFLKNTRRLKFIGMSYYIRGNSLHVFKSDVNELTLDILKNNLDKVIGVCDYYVSSCSVVYLNDNLQAKKRYLRFFTVNIVIVMIALLYFGFCVIGLLLQSILLLWFVFYVIKLIRAPRFLNKQYKTQDLINEEEKEIILDIDVDYNTSDLTPFVTIEQSYLEYQRIDTGEWVYGEIEPAPFWFGADDARDILYYEALDPSQEVSLTLEPQSDSVKVSADLQDHEFNWLRQVISSSIGLEKSIHTTSPHPVASALRNAAIEYVRRQIPAGCRVLHVGSEVKHWPAEGHVHSIPMLDIRDPIRRSKQLEYIRKLHREKGVVIEWTGKRLQEICGKFDILIFVHSAYDIRVEEIFYNAKRLGASTVYILLHFSTELFLRNSGILPSVGQKFVKNSFLDEKEVKSGQVKFVQLHESEVIYQHDLDNLKKLYLTRDVKYSNQYYYSGGIVMEHPDTHMLKYDINDGKELKPYTMQLLNKELHKFRYFKLIVSIVQHIEYVEIIYDEYFLPNVLVKMISGILDRVKEYKDVETFWNVAMHTFHPEAYEEYHPVASIVLRDDQFMKKLYVTLVSLRLFKQSRCITAQLKKFITCTCGDSASLISESVLEKFSYQLPDIADLVTSVKDRLWLKSKILDLSGVMFIPELGEDSPDALRYLARRRNVFSRNQCFGSTIKVNFKDNELKYNVVGNIVRGYGHRYILYDILTDCAQLRTVDRQNLTIRIMATLWKSIPMIIIHGKMLYFNDLSESRLITDNLIMELTNVWRRIVMKFEVPLSDKYWSKFTTVNVHNFQDVLILIGNLERFIKCDYCFLSFAYFNERFPYEYKSKLMGEEPSFVTIPSHVIEVCNNKAIGMIHNNSVYYGDYLPEKWCLVIDQHVYPLKNIRLADISLFERRDLQQWCITLGLVPKLTKPSVRRYQVLESMLLNVELRMFETMPDMKRSLAILEVFKYNIMLELNVISNFELIHSCQEDHYMRAVTSTYIFDLNDKKYINGQPDSKLLYAWDGKDFVLLRFLIQKFKYDLYLKSRRFVYLNQDVEYIRSRSLTKRLYEKLDEILSYQYENIKFILVDGVPGCGKTHTISHYHCKNEDLVCTATRAALGDYIKSFGRSEYYRTYDSIMLNGAPEVSRVFADEALMIHPGEMLIVCFLAKCREVRMYGDTNQIPFINRCNQLELKHLNVIDFDKITTMKLTYRLPRIMINIFDRVYPDIETASQIFGSVKVVKGEREPQLNDIGKCYLTFTQFEKETLLRFNSGYKVMTIHESQGQTYDHVEVIRLIVQDNIIYASRPHIVVAFSRHRETLVYRTVVKGDVPSQFLNLNKSIEFKDLKTEVSQSTKINLSCRKEKSIYQALIKSKHFDDDVLEMISLDRGLNFNESVTIQINLLKLDYPILSKVNSDTSIAMLQYCLDSIYDRSTRKIPMIIYPLDKHINVELSKFVSSIFSEQYKVEEYCTPKLQTPQPTRLRNTVAEILLAIQRRNLNPPILHLTVSSEVIKQVVDVFMETFLDFDKMKDSMKKHSLENAVYLYDWYSTRTKLQRSFLNLEKYGTKRSDVYYCHVKPDVKPPLDNTHNDQITSGQVITAHHPLITASLTTLAKYVGCVLKESIYDKWLINDGFNLMQLSGHMHSILQDQTEIKYQEIDFSKFDKSQGEVLLLAQLELMRRLGVSEDYLQEWFESHTINKLLFMNIGVTITTQFQRRSGDVFTFLGNTLVTMMVLAFTYDFKRALGGIFGGDDSLVVFSKDVRLFDRTSFISETFNLYAKVENHPNAPYFASKFLVQAEGHWYFVPDPLKAIVRLGRSDMRCKEHIELYHVSFSDNLKLILNDSICLAVKESIISRYKERMKNITFVIDYILNFLKELLEDKEKFIHLFEAPNHIWYRKLSAQDKEELIQAIEPSDVEMFTESVFTPNRR